MITKYSLYNESVVLNKWGYDRQNESVRSKMTGKSPEVALSDFVSAPRERKIEMLWNNLLNTFHNKGNKIEAFMRGTYRKLNRYSNQQHITVVWDELEKLSDEELVEFARELLRYEVTNEGVRDKMTPIGKDKYDEFIKRFDDFHNSLLWGKKGMITMIRDNFKTEDIERKIDEFIDPDDMVIWTSQISNYGGSVSTYDKLEALNKGQLKELFDRLVGNVNEGVRDKMTPMSIEDIEDIFKERNFDFRTPLVSATFRGDDEAVDEILFMMDKVYRSTEYGSREVKERIEGDFAEGLSTAIEEGSSSMVETYLSHDINGVKKEHMYKAMMYGSEDRYGFGEPTYCVSQMLYLDPRINHEFVPREREHYEKIFREEIGE